MSRYVTEPDEFYQAFPCFAPYFLLTEAMPIAQLFHSVGQCLVTADYLRARVCPVQHHLKMVLQEAEDPLQ